MREITISAGSAKLSGIIHEPTGSDALRDVLVICHGFRGSKDGGGRAVLLAERVSQLGLYAVRFDFTPLSTLTRQISELAAVVTFCRESFGGSIYLLGRSMGGSAAIAFAGLDKMVSGLCLWATPWNLPETFRLALGEHYNWLEEGRTIILEDEYGRVKLAPDFVSDFARYDLLKSINLASNIPIVIIHGDQDEIVPLARARELYRHFRGPKRLVIIKGGDHQFTRHYQAANDAVIIWLSELLNRVV